MDLIHNLALGLGVAFTLQNLLYAFGGALLGTLIGVLPGLGPVATIAMLLPSIYSLDATPAPRWPRPAWVPSSPVRWPRWWWQPSRPR